MLLLLLSNLSQRQVAEKQNSNIKHLLISHFFIFLSDNSLQSQIIKPKIPENLPKTHLISSYFISLKFDPFFLLLFFFFKGVPFFQLIRKMTVTKSTLLNSSVHIIIHQNHLINYFIKK